MKIKKKLKKYGDGGLKAINLNNIKPKAYEEATKEFGDEYSKNYTNDVAILDKNKESIDFLNNWYKDRLPFLYGEQGKQYLDSKEYKDNLLAPNPVQFLTPGREEAAQYKSTGSLDPKATENFYNGKYSLPIIRKYKTENKLDQFKSNLDILVDKERSVYINPSIANTLGNREALTHENSHKYDRFLPELFEKDSKVISSYTPNINTEDDTQRSILKLMQPYTTKPTEVKSRLMEIRKRTGLLPTDVIDEKKFNEIQNKSKELFKDKEDFSPLEELKFYYKDNEIIDLLNKVSENKSSQEQIPMARNGGSIKKYPNGGKPPKYEWSKGIDNIQPITQTQNNSSITTGNKKLSTEELKKAAEYTKKYNQQHLEDEYNSRQNKLKESLNSQKQPLSVKNLQTQTQSTGDKLSLAMNSKYGNPKDYPTLSGYMQGLDYINPFKMIGDMASGLGSVPQDVNEGNYLKAGLSVASPLAVGAMAGVGANSVKPFVNNLVNPLAGTGEVINNLGNKYLPNAYKLNPNAFKPNPNNFYRQVDTPTFNEGLESGLIRGKQDIGYSDESAMKMFGDDAYYNKGRLYYKNEKDYPYLFEANLPEDRFIPKVNGRTRKYTTENTRVRVSKEPLPINDPNIKTYKKDWLQGYKPIEIPKKQNGGNITRESEWELVNEDLPKAGNGLSLVKTLTPIGNKVIPRNPSLYKDAINNVDKIEHNINDRYRVQADDFTDKNYPTDYDEDSGHNDYVDALRHSATAMYTTSGQGNFLAPLKVPYTNVMGLAHELKGLGNFVSATDKLTWQGAKQQLRETGSDLYNNFVGSMIGGLPINIENKEKILKFAKDKNILSDLSKKQNGGNLPKRRLNLNKSSDWEIVD